MPTADFPNSQSKSEHTVTVLLVMQKKAHTPISQRKRNSSWHWILEELLTLCRKQLCLHRAGLECCQRDF